MSKIDRRTFLGTAAGVTVGVSIGSTPKLFAAPALHIGPLLSNPIAISSTNGLRGIALAAELMESGMDTLDAAIEGVKIQELDPNDRSVGYGGLPNEEGVVQLDASCMHGPTRRAGAVAALEGIKTPSVVAKYVLKYTDHDLLVGEGAKRFALSYGFQEEDLLTDRSRESWLKWRANRDHRDDWVDVDPDATQSHRPTGTINMNVINPAGDISSITTTSGLAWKIPGRAGDSPIIGAGQYTDNDIGAAGSTGRGEANIEVCGAFLTVENMRRGMSPTDAALDTLRRVVHVSEARLLDDRGRPTFGLSFYAVNKNGDFGAASIWAGRTHAAFDGQEARVRDSAYLFERD